MSALPDKKALTANLRDPIQSQLQRFISRDPIGLEGGANLYSYCGNAPTKFVDPMGLQKFDFLDCLGDCMEKYDPTSIFGRTILNWTNMPVNSTPPFFLGGSKAPQNVKDMFAWANSLGQKAAGTKGATSPLLIAGQKMPGKAGAAVRGLGQVGFHVRLAYGNYMALVEISCLVSCAKKTRECDGRWDPQIYYFLLGLWTYLADLATPIPGSVDWTNWDGRVMFDMDGESITIEP